MIGIKISPLLPKSGGQVTYDTNAQAYFNRIDALAQTAPSLTQKGRYNTLFQSLKTYNGYDNLSLHDRMWIFGSEVETNGLVSLANPSSTLAAKVLAPTWTQYAGYVGSPGYLDSNYTPSIDGVNYLLNGSCIWVYSRTNATDLTCVIGAFDATKASNIYPNYTGFGALVNMSDLGNNTIGSIPSTKGLLLLKRTNATTLEYWINGILVATKTISSTALVTVKFFIGARNSSNVAGDKTTRQIAAAGIGSSSIQPWYLNYSLEQYLDGLGTATPLVTDKRLNILIWGQSNNTANFAYPGLLPASHKATLTDAYSNANSGGVNPFINPVQAYHEAFNSFPGITTGTFYAWTAYLAYRLSVTHGRKCVITNYSVGGTRLNSVGSGAQTWDFNTPGNLRDIAYGDYFLPAVYKNNPLAETIMIINIGETDMDTLAAANNFYANMVAQINKYRSPIASGGLGQPNMKVFIIKTYSSQLTYHATIKQAEMDITGNGDPSLALPLCFLIDPETYGTVTTTGNDGIHLSEAFVGTYFGNGAADYINSIVT